MPGGNRAMRISMAEPPLRSCCVPASLAFYWCAQLHLMTRAAFRPIGSETDTPVLLRAQEFPPGARRQKQMHLRRKNARRTEELRKTVEANKERTRLREERNAKAMANIKLQEKEYRDRQRAENNKRHEQLLAKIPGGDAIRLSNNANAANPFESAEANPTKIESANENKKEDGQPDFVESVPQSSQTATQRRKIQGKWGPALMTFARAKRKNRIDNVFKLTTMIGAEQNAGKLFFYPTAFHGVEVITFGAIEIVPITKRDTPSDNAIVRSDENNLIGFNLALDGDNIGGIQGVF